MALPNEDLDGNPAERLTHEALAELDRGDLQEARRLSTQLREMRYTAHFEIEALILLEEEKPERAIEVLREGVEKAPDVWSLWQLLGNCVSDAGEFAEAMICYDKALDLENADRASLLFNRATVLSRTDRSEEALQVLERVVGALEADAVEWDERLALRGRTWTLRLQQLADLNRCEQLVEEANQLRAWLDEVAAREGDEDETALSSQSNWQVEQEGLTWSQAALALADCGAEDEAREWAERALSIYRCDEDALDLLREMISDAPLATRSFSVDLEGEWPLGDEEDESAEFGFCTCLHVVARDAEEAEALALEMEGQRWQDPLRVRLCRDDGECDEQPIGVFKVTHYRVFPRDEGDQSDEDEDQN